MEQKLPPKILKTQFRSMGTQPVAKAIDVIPVLPAPVEPVTTPPVEEIPVSDAAQAEMVATEPVAAEMPVEAAVIQGPAADPVASSPSEPEPISAEPEAQPVEEAQAVAAPVQAASAPAPEAEVHVHTKPLNASIRPRANQPVGTRRMAVSTVAESAQPDLPVLAAFQDFLEAERQKMKGRLMTVIVIFTLVVLAVGAGSVMLAMRFSESSLMNVREGLQRNLESTQTDVAALAEKLGAVDEMKAESAKLRDELNAKAAVVDALEKRFGGDGEDEIKSLKESLSSLKTRNENMDAELSKLRVVPDKLEAIRKELQSIRDRKTAPVLVAEPPPQPAPAVQPAPAKVTKSLSLPVSPGGIGTPVTWKAPIP